MIRPGSTGRGIVRALLLSVAWLTLQSLCGCSGAHLDASAKGAQVQGAAPGLTSSQLIDIGQALWRRGETVRAEQYWVRALSQGADPDVVLPLLLAAYIQDGQYRLAIQRAEDHVRRHPRAPHLRLLLGALQEAIGAHQQAIAQYSAVVDQEPDRAEGHYALASALLQQGHDRARADQHFRRYLALDPEGPHAEHARAALLIEVAP